MTETDIQTVIEPGHFRSVLGHYPTGVCVITGADEDGTAAGLVVGSFTSVSLDPPLVAFFPDRSSSSWPRLRGSGYFCVNVLADDQIDLCRRFAARGGDKFEGIPYRLSRRGIPLLGGVVAHIECAIADEIDAGDHTIVLGLVEALAVERAAGPLLFLKGTYGAFAADT
ncbi:flavin reductase family protein [Novosphingobium sp. PASSN1]|uniref:flavin reductase family protein n=1 Tax=Novosphingobium sp. PASSN1 TaxID=2015561 RepID=UPI000BDC33A8|nr:flavin reductase family protein [Novosphingobium sp. PASSN1]OYU34515.1 MAG: monooxygenase [Novosphingobium sp. PASSN1]